jgi:hypothetical protein
MNFNNKIKKYVINSLIRESDDEAWEFLKTLNPNCDDLDHIITKTKKYQEEAWELYKKQSPKKEDLIYLIKCSDKSKEALAYLLQHFALDNKDLKSILESTKNDAVAKLLLKQNPSNEELESIMRYSNLKDEAAKELLKRSPDNDELYSIIEYSNLKQEAWKKLLQQSPSNEELICMIQHTDLHDIAWEYLLTQNPTNEELMDFVINYADTGRKQKEAAQLLLEKTLSMEELVDLIRSNQFADEAWERLKAQSPDYDDLFYLIWRGTVKTNEAAEYCLNLNPDKEFLWEIFEYSDKKDEAALQLIQMPLELNELANIVLKSSIAPVLDLLSERVQFDRTKVNENELIKEIAAKILNNPALLNVKHWHEGETHCLGGWAIALNEDAQKIEKQYGSEIAASLLLPSYTNLFFVDKEMVLNELKKVGF